LLIEDCGLRIGNRKQSAIGNRQSAIGNRHSSIGNRQSAIGTRQSTIIVNQQFPIENYDSSIINRQQQSSICNRQSSMLPASIPLFPLPNVVLFPSVFLPLHIFEPRYRRMVTEALEGDRIIGMVLLRPGWEANYEGRPAVYPIGCAGLITHAEPLPDGRFNIVLRGLEKFRIVGEDTDRDYRVGRIETLMEEIDEVERTNVRAERRRLEALLVPQPEGRGTDPKVPPSMADEDLVNALAQYLELEPVEKQALLEREGLLARCRALIELLEMKVISSQHKWQGTH
jgi:Lon protease-like protein